jgi:hypothetical protein
LIEEYPNCRSQEMSAVNVQCWVISRIWRIRTADPEVELSQGVDESRVVLGVVGPLPVGEVLEEGFFRRAFAGTPGGRISHQPLHIGSVRLGVTTEGTQFVGQPHGSSAVANQAGDAHGPAYRDFKWPVVELVWCLPYKRQHIIGRRHPRDSSDPSGTASATASLGGGYGGVPLQVDVEVTSEAGHPGATLAACSSLSQLRRSARV